MELRTYQQDAIARIGDALRGSARRRVVFTLPTGGGKTVVMSFMARKFVERGKRVLFLAHRRTLIKQIGEAIGLTRNIRVESVQTFVRQPSQADVLFIDEAHHATSASYRKAVEQCGAGVIIGVTATPERKDGAGLDSVFDGVVIGESMRWLIDNRYLAEYRYFSPRGMHDPLAGAASSSREFSQAQQSAAAEAKGRFGDAVRLYRQHLAGRRAIAFGYNVKDARNIAQQFNAAGIPAASISGKDAAPLVDAHIAAFKSGALSVLTSCDLISEGFDVPEAAGVLLMRATQSLTVHLQQVGRCLRPKAEGGRAVILDMVGNIDRHGLPDDERAWDIAGRKKRSRGIGKPATKACPECDCVVGLSARTCPNCGYQFSSDFTEYKAANLEEITDDQRELFRKKLSASEWRRRQEENAAARSIDELIALGIARGYDHPRAWAAHEWQRQREAA